MKLQAKIIVLITLTFSYLLSAEAAPYQYRCQGMVRYRPCTVKPLAINPQRARASIPGKQRAPTAIPNDWYAEVIKQDFSSVTKRDGVWKGRVKGNGMVHLTLVIFRGGIVESRTYMGGVKLVNKDTAFRFRAAMPAGKVGKEWSWRVVAFNAVGTPV